MKNRTIAAWVCLSVLAACAAYVAAQEKNSNNDEQLQKALQRWPRADADGNGVLTESEARKFTQGAREKGGENKERPAQPKPAPTFADVSYGPHPRNVLDLYLAQSDKPTPLVAYIHGGGFKGGSKSGVNPAVVNTCLKAGISVVSIEYRFREDAPIQDILRDCGRAIQFLRCHADKWNIDKKRIGSFGGSAGAGASLWLAFHDDLADPDSAEPVLRESSRLAVAGSLNGQFSYDVAQWPELLGAYPGDGKNLPDYAFYHFKSEEEMYTEAGKKIRADVDMRGLITQDDAPVFLSCSLKNTPSMDHNQYVHHPLHSIAIQKKCAEVGVECEIRLRSDSEIPSRETTYEQMLKFFFKRLGVEK